MFHQEASVETIKLNMSYLQLELDGVSIIIRQEHHGGNPPYISFLKIQRASVFNVGFYFCNDSDGKSVSTYLYVNGKSDTH